MAALAAVASPWLTPDEATEYTKFTRRTLDRYVHDGLLTAYRMGPRAVRFHIDDLDALALPIPAGGHDD
jgi:excisionase family DNA binding protein